MTHRPRVRMKSRVKNDYERENVIINKGQYVYLPEQTFALNDDVTTG